MSQREQEPPTAATVSSDDATPRVRRSRAGPPRWWKGGVAAAHDLGEWAKLVALLLAVAGLLGVLLPDTKRWWEINLYPESWYYIGQVRGGTFRPFAYQHPLWNDGPVAATALAGLPGSVVVTMNDELHIGRSRAGRDGAVRTVSKGGVCLYVRHVERRASPDGAASYVWVGTAKVTC